MMSLTVKGVYVTYRDWVSRNPQITSDIESAVKWISYFVSGRISDSSVVSELVYSISNLLVLFNDKIIIQSQSFHSPSQGDQLKTWVTILEYSEVFIEVTALKLWGEKGKWIVVVLIQLLKCAARLTLLFHHKEHIIQNPPFTPLERKQISKEKDLLNIGISNPGFRLQSGRVIRTINASDNELYENVKEKSGKKRKKKSAGPVHSRTWQPPVLPPTSSIEGNDDPPLNNVQLIGEAMYVAKPLMHLGASYYFKSSQWMPWLISLGLDTASLQLLKCQNERKFSRRQNLEISRRNLSLLLYLLRSPFYERHTREKLNKTLLTLSDNLPLVGMVLRPLAQFIPRWQETYFYMWST